MVIMKRKKISRATLKRATSWRTKKELFFFAVSNFVNHATLNFISKHHDWILGFRERKKEKISFKFCFKSLIEHTERPKLRECEMIRP